jgi:hypothetical protein
MTEDGRGSDRPPTQEDIDSLELQQMALEDTKRQLESALKILGSREADLAQSARRRRLLGDEGGVEILGLKDECSLGREFAKWVRDTVTKHVHIVGGNVIWEDVIPTEFGDYLRENCDTMA